MGKPFKKEIEESLTTIDWALKQEIGGIYERIFKDTSKPLFIVGSGGSLSACYFASSLYQTLGGIAKAITPLELYYTRFALKDAKILFLSSSGRNNDILFAFNVAIQNHTSEITTICMRKGSELAKLANSFSISQGIEFEIPTKKDGFLATNSLTAFFTVLASASDLLNDEIIVNTANTTQNNAIFDFINKLNKDFTITVLYAGWGTAVAYDIESKFTEAALGGILLADYRNFGHGRHHWFAKKGSNSALIAIVTPEEKKIAEKTINLLPDDIPVLVLASEKNGPNSSIELLIQAYKFVNNIGELLRIDPGRPGVPEFGRKLYHLKYSSFYKPNSTHNIGTIEERSILMKTMSTSISKLDQKTLIFWRQKYLEFVNRLTNTTFSSIVFDYDGTLCSYDNRYKGFLNLEIADELIRLLDAGITIGIATGRGKSVKSDLRNSKIPKTYWKNIIIGYYNGSEVSTLDDDNSPNTNTEPNQQLTLLDFMLKKLEMPKNSLVLNLKPNQLTIETSIPSQWGKIRKLILNIVMTSSFDELLLLESSHSMDIVVRSKASKLNVVKRCIEVSENNHCLTIGDKGQWPGNDYELLSGLYSLSVDEISTNPDSCWNLSEIGINRTDSTLSYLKKIVAKQKFFNISI